MLILEQLTSQDDCC